MKVISTCIPDVLILEPAVFTDTRGYFLESFNQRIFDDAVGKKYCFVQDNQSCSGKGVLRGLHYQTRQAQGKLVRAARGRVFDVAVDIRPESATFGKWVGVELDEDNHRQLWIPPGLAHGFLVLSEKADVLYKATEYYAPDYERVIRWDDPRLGISWPIEGLPILSPKDADAPYLDPGLQKRCE